MTKEWIFPFFQLCINFWYCDHVNLYNYGILTFYDILCNKKTSYANTTENYVSNIFIFPNIKLLEECVVRRSIKPIFIYLYFYKPLKPTFDPSCTDFTYILRLILESGAFFNRPQTYPQHRILYGTPDNSQRLCVKGKYHNMAYSPFTPPYA